MKKIDKHEVIDNMVVKSNALIQRSRYDLSIQQQKIILYLISQINPNDTEFREFEFSIVDFCKTCGIDCDSGQNYHDLKAAVKGIRDKSCWVELENGEEVTVSWIGKAIISKGSGRIRIQLDPDMKPFLLQLKSNYTQYELIYTLHFRSKYTIRLYEFIKSIHFKELQPYCSRIYTLDEIRQILGAEKYDTFQHLKERVLNPSIREINEHSDKTVSYETVRSGRKITGIVFSVGTKPVDERIRVLAEIERQQGTAAAGISSVITGE